MPLSLYIVGKQFFIITKHKLAFLSCMFPAYAGIQYMYTVQNCQTFIYFYRIYCHTHTKIYYIIIFR